MPAGEGLLQGGAAGDHARGGDGTDHGVHPFHRRFRDQLFHQRHHPDAAHLYLFHDPQAHQPGNQCSVHGDVRRGDGVADHHKCPQREGSGQGRTDQGGGVRCHE